MLVTLALPSAPGSESRAPTLAFAPARPRAWLEAEGVYPNPLRTALELEALYPPAPSERAGAGLVALTFDTEIPRGGEARQTVTQVLDVLRDENVRATFFVVGAWARANLDILRRMAAEGHEIANHSDEHRPFARRSDADVRRDLDRVAELVERETGQVIAPLFRPPYGCLDAAAARVVRQRGYALAGWTATGRDAAGETEGPLAVVQELEADLEPGAVILLHTNRWITAAALPLVLARARDKGLLPVTLSTALRHDAGRREQIARRAARPCSALGRSHGARRSRG